jgi:hypothetical protein
VGTKVLKNGNNSAFPFFFGRNNLVRKLILLGVSWSKSLKPGKRKFIKLHAKFCNEMLKSCTLYKVKHQKGLSYSTLARALFQHPGHFCPCTADLVYVSTLPCTTNIGHSFEKNAFYSDTPLILPTKFRHFLIVLIFDGPSVLWSTIRWSGDKRFTV